MRVCAIINPKAGRGRTGDTRTDLRALVERSYPGATILETQGPGDEVRLGKLCATDGTELLLSIGGDGTLNGVLNGLLSGGTRTLDGPILAPVPAGTGGDFARGLGYPADPEAVLSALRTYEPSAVDAGTLDFADGSRRYWINQSYVGLGARVVDRVNRSNRRSGRRAYTMASLSEAFHVRCSSIALRPPPEANPESLLNLVVANGTHSGGGMLTAPGASLTDGQFELIVIGRAAISGAFPRLKVLKNLSRFKDGSYTQLKGVERRKVSTLEVEGDPTELVEADGEIVGHLPVRYALLPRAIRVLRPRAP